jgi:peptide/nickel transport system permease protein
VLRFVVRRLILLVPILIGLSIFLFLFVRALPGGPAEALLGERATPEAVAQINRQYGLDKPIYEQYYRYVKNVVTFDLGDDVVSRRPVTEEISRRFPATVELGLSAMLVAVLFGIPLGFLAAKYHGSVYDHASLVTSLLGISVPVFVLGLILKYIFAIKLGWLPSQGRQDVLLDAEHPTKFYVLDGIVTGNGEAFVDAVKHLVLPAIALGSIPLAVIARITRAAVLDVKNEDYVRTARAKGVAPGVVDRRHILRNALLPVVTIIGLQTGLLLAGAVLTETVFNIQGLGYWLTQAVEQRNYAVLQGGVLFVSVVFVLVNLLVDVSYAIINPRIRYA